MKGMTLTIRTDNIKRQHQYDLVCKLKACLHPTINDLVSQRLIEEEIKTRKMKGEWDWDIPGVPDNIYAKANQKPPPSLELYSIPSFYNSQ